MCGMDFLFFYFILCDLNKCQECSGIQQTDGHSSCGLYSTGAKSGRLSGRSEIPVGGERKQIGQSVTDVHFYVHMQCTDVHNNASVVVVCREAPGVKNKSRPTITIK